MSGYFYVTDFTVPAGTAIAAPAKQAVALDNRNLASVRFVIPDGHNGLTGVAVRAGGVNVAPQVQGTWLTGNNEIVDFAYADEIQTAGFTLFGYNTDIFAHTFHLRWFLTDLAAPTPVSIDSPQSAPFQPAGVSATVATLTGALTAADIAQLDAAAAESLTAPQLAGVTP